MPVYEYTAKNRTGHIFKGSYEDTKSISSLRDEMSKMGYELLKVNRDEKIAKKKRIKQAEVVAFIYQLAGMCSAGISISKSLKTLEEQVINHSFKNIISEIRRDIEAGSNLKKAFEKHKKIFSDFILGMIEAGESTGKLSEAFNMSAEYLEKRMDLHRKVRSAFIYPIFVGSVCLIVLIGLLIFVVPVFAKIYAQLHVTLPGPTLVLVGLSNLIRHWWWAIIIILFAAIILLRSFMKSPLFRKKWDIFKLEMPVFGQLNRLVVISHFTRTFAMLESVGVSIIDSLNVANAVAHNYKMNEIVNELKLAIKGGHPLGNSMKQYNIFPPMVIQLAISGEEAGILSNMLLKGADFIDKDIDRATQSLLAKLEPSLTVVMGVIVGSILMAVYLPMFDYMTHLK